MLNEKALKKLYCKNVKGNRTMKHDLMLREPELYFDSIHNELNNFLRDTLLVHANPLNMKKNSIWRPAIEVKQNEKEYKVRVQLPGVNKDDIEVELDNDFMTITAEIHEEKEEKEEKAKNERYHTSEFRYGRYQRTISFDQPIRTDECNAIYDKGILTITIPKVLTEHKEAKKLEIKEK